MQIKQGYRFTPAAVLRFTGDDHAEFLHNQGTADLKIPLGNCRYTLWLDFQGRIIGDSFVMLVTDKDALVVSYHTPASQLIEKFNKHIIADDVEIEDLTHKCRMICVPRDGITKSPGPDEFLCDDGSWLWEGRLLGRKSIDIVYLKEAPEFDVDEPMSEDVATALRVESGIPLVPVDTGSADMNPVEAGMLSAVSFEKGCYLGQEVVARVQRLGRTNRRMVHFSTTNSELTDTLDLVVDGKTVGRITTLIKGTEKIEGIGWLKSRLEDGQHVLSGISLDVRSLPES